MGKRGPQPQPLELRKLRGNPGKRAMPTVPLGKPKVPKCPQELKHLRKTWNYYASILSELGILRETDELAWNLLFRTFDKYMMASKEAKIGRITIEGRINIDPLLTVEIKYLNTLMRLLDRFGMCPTSRSSLNVEKPKKEDEFSRFLAMRKVASD